MTARDAHWSEMDHARIDENQIADRYLMGKLPDEERRRFEEHFVDCATCLERLETVESLRGALKDLPPGETSSAPAPGKTASFGRREPQRTRPLVVLLAAACLLLAVSASVFFYSEIRRTRRELASARRASVQAHDRRAELERALQRERAARARLSDAVAALRAAPLAASVFVLDRTRGAAPTEPENRVFLGDPAGWVALVFDRPDQPGFRSYRVRISTTDGRPVGGPVTADASSGGMLAVSVPASLLAGGDYLLRIEGLGPGPARALATYRFRVVRGN